MDYKKKIEYATMIAKELQRNNSTEQIEKNLKSEGYMKGISRVYLLV